MSLHVTGTATATYCSNTLCHNGGTCITAGSQNVLCSCPRGYRGPRCELRVPSCQYFGNWTANYRGYYYTKDSYEGSLSSWFCGRGSQLEFGFSVCENRYYSPSWSNLPTCHSATARSRRSAWYWARTTRYPERTDLFESVNAWLRPLVVVGVFLVQTLSPFIIYDVLLKCCGYREKTSKPFAIADQRENRAIAERYKTELEELEGRSLAPENTVAFNELRRIRQQLEEETDQLRARRRERSREKWKTVQLSRIVSLCYYISFWLWIIYLIAAFGAKLSQYASLFAILIICAIVSVSCLPCVFVIESGFSGERQYIANFKSLTSTEDSIESIRNTQPTITMKAECYHYETRTRTVSFTDAHGNRRSKQETYRVEVVTALIVEPFRFTHWFDSSEIMPADVHKAGITKIKMNLTVQFGDEATAANFAERYRQFKLENQFRDELVRFSVSSTVAGFKKRLAAYTGTGTKPGWISSVWFWLATCFCLGWPYRIMFNRATGGKTECSVVKLIFIDTPPTQDTSSNADVYNETVINDIKTSIQAMLCQLERSSDNNDGIPIKRTDTDRHLNVELREAHHAPQPPQATNTPR